MKVKYFILLLWFSSSFIIALLIFAKGLLLHRDVLPNKATCINNTAVDCTDTEYSLSDYCKPSHVNDQPCIPSNFKVILVIIDALRYDFVEYDHHISIVDPLPYVNKLTIIRDLLEKNSKNSRLFKLISDPPTTTMQRIIGLTTGSLPTFVDVGSNFATSEINEDNIIDLLNRRNKKSIFLGDDTWCKLYPNRFTRNFPFDSFNVWDLDTVDAGIQEHLFSELGKTDWHLLIAHFLGVDHCGHRYGPNHPEMARKLTEMNAVLKRIVDEIQGKQDVLLFVIGDHGMTSTGDHGGDTTNEVTTALFAYSPVHQFYLEHLRSTNRVSQVDLTPTLSSILGIPIPFSNLGSVILDCIPRPLLSSVSRVTFVLWRNVDQITNYMREYFSHNSQFKATKKLDVILRSYTRLKNLQTNVRSENISAFISEYEIYMSNVLRMCQEVWAQFDYWSVSAGLLFMLFSLALCCCIINKLTVDNIHRCISKKFFRLFEVFAFATPVVIFLCCSFLSTGLELTSYIAIEISSVLLMSWVCIQLYTSIEVTFSCISYSHVTPDSFIFFECILLFAGLFSNSFVIEEPSVIMYFFVSTVFIFLLFYSKNLNYVELPYGFQNFLRSYVTFFFTWDVVKFATVVSVAFRLGYNFIKCREEQVRCKDVIGSKYEIWLSVLAVILTLSFLNFCHEAVRTHSIVFHFIIKLCGVLMSIYWMSETIFEDYTYTGKIPTLVLLTCLGSFYYLLYEPSSICNVIDIAETQKSEEKCLQFIFDSAFGKLFLVLCLLSCTLLGQLYAVPTILMFVFLMSLPLLLQNSKRNFRQKQTNYDVPWSYVILWGMSSIYWFYATGHYASFSGIQWNAAFLIQKEIGNNMLIPGILVMLNTFISYIVHAMLLPLLLTNRLFSNFELAIEDPQKVRTRIQKLMYVNECETYCHNAFILVLKYICFFGARLLIVMMSSTILSRHLMMWKVFAPKLIFEGIAFIAITIPSLLIALWFMYRIEKPIMKVFKSYLKI